MRLALTHSGRDIGLSHDSRLATPWGGYLAQRWISLGFAVLISASLFGTAQEAPLPALGWAGAFLFLAIEQDVRRRKIPNLLTLPALAFAIALAAVNAGVAGAGAALLGAATGFGLLFLPFAFRVLGAGDVKAVMVLGALWGVGILLPALFWMVVVGGLLAIAAVIVDGGLLDLIRRWAESLKLSVLTRRLHYVAPTNGTAAAGAVPFALAMGLGAAAFQLWGTPWI